MMNNIYTEKDISLSLLFDYTFKKLSPDKDQAMELFLDEHEDYADLVDGILNYCLNEKVKTKADLEKSLASDKTNFFKKYPQLEKLAQSKTTQNKVLKKKNNFRYLLLSMLLLLGSFAIWKISNLDNNSIDDPKPNIQTPIDSSDEEEEEKKIEKINSPTKTPKSSAIAELEMSLEKNKALALSASDLWKSEFTQKGNNTILENAEKQIEAGNPSQNSLFCVGLNELTKADPDLNKAIELLQQVNQNDYPDATWFLFRTYVLSNEMEKAKIEFGKMQASPAQSKYYKNKFLSPSIIKSFQSIR